MAEPEVITPYKVKRACEPKLDVAQLTFKSVDVSESVYTRALIHLQGASLPAGIMVPTRPKPQWSALHPEPAIAVMRMRREPGPWGPDDVPPVLPPDPLPPPPPEPLPPSDEVDVEEPEPSLVPYDLYLMLKYQQVWRPSGYGIGELLFTTSLMPDEELTLEVKTWETSRIQQDTEDTTDQRNASDIKNTTSSSAEAASEHQTKTHEHIDAKASYSGFGFSASVEGGWSQDVADLQKSLEKRAQEQAEQTTSEYRMTHKVKVAVSRESGSESKTTRRIKNVNQAHTLNTNYYEVLREFAVEVTPYSATIVLLGAEPDLRSWTGFSTWSAIPVPISLGHLIRASQSAAWVQQFIDAHGVSPVKIMREQWSAPLYDAALARLEWWGDKGVEIRPEDRELFQSTVLRYVRPTPGWVEPDERGALRWGYEVQEGKEQELLAFLYEFLPYSPQQIMARALGAKMKPTAAARAITSRFARAVIPPYDHLARASRLRAIRLTVEPEHLELKAAKTILVPGPFLEKSVADPEKWRKFAEEWVKTQILDELKKLRPQLGKPTRAWKATLPTQGIYADLALGMCSGAEDYFEITRQFDLEIKRTEIRRLELEVEKLRLQNEALQQGKPAVVVETDAATTGVKLDLTLPEAASRVEIKKPGS